MAPPNFNEGNTHFIPFTIEQVRGNEPITLSDNDNESILSDDPASTTKKRVVLIIILSIIGLVALIIHFARPSNPKILLQDATVFSFSLSPAPPHFLNSSLQITLASHNPNQISAIDYTDLCIYAEYKNQPITFKTTIPSVYQRHKETNVWSLFINGNNFPIAPYNVPVVTMDQSNGIANIVIKLDGQLKWKIIGSLNTRKYHFHVLCNIAIMDFRGNAAGAVTDQISRRVFVFSSVKYLLHRWCSVDAV